MVVAKVFANGDDRDNFSQSGNVHEETYGDTPRLLFVPCEVVIIAFSDFFGALALGGKGSTSGSGGEKMGNRCQSLKGWRAGACGSQDYPLLSNTLTGINEGG
jgi:hypothetical protein